MSEGWFEIDDFIGYDVHESGVVSNGYSGLLLTASLNAEGIPSVGLRKEGRGQVYRRSVPLLVANAFLPDPPRHDFNTPIQLDGDRLNCHATNLMWRPRWFAIKYHQERRVEPFPNWNRPFEVIQTREVFEHPRDCAVTHGLLESSNCGICIAIVNEISVWPTVLDLRFI